MNSHTFISCVCDHLRQHYPHETHRISQVESLDGLVECMACLVKTYSPREFYAHMVPLYTSVSAEGDAHTHIQEFLTGHRQYQQICELFAGNSDVPSPSVNPSESQIQDILQRLDRVEQTIRELQYYLF